jgi:hypothetical protein
MDSSNVEDAIILAYEQNNFLKVGKILDQIKKENYTMDFGVDSCDDIRIIIECGFDIINEPYFTPNRHIPYIELIKEHIELLRLHIKLLLSKRFSSKILNNIADYVNI